MNNRMDGCEYIAQSFKAQGVTHVFYIEAMFKMLLRELGPVNIKPIMAHTENAAAYMADGYARVSGKPAVCWAQSIGAANLAGGIHEAWLANSPVIALTGKKNPDYQYRGSYQEADHTFLYERLTKFNADISDSKQLPHVLRHLFRNAVTGKPRPVHTDISNHTGRTMEIATVDAPVYEEPVYTKYPAYRPAADEEAVKAAATKIAGAKQPVIVIGRGAAISGAGKEIYELAKKTDIPVVTSPDGKTMIDESNDLWCGIVGSYGMDCANKAVKKADLVIYIGTQTGDQTTFDWKVPSMETEVIQIDIDPIELGKNYPNCIGLLGDAKVVTAQLAQAAEKAERADWRAECRELLKETLDRYAVHQNSDDLPMRPERLCQEVSKALPDNAVLFADTGFSAVWASTMIRMKATQEFYRAAGSLGWSYPASLGGKCATDKPVICFTGDGAFYYHLNEMETAIRNGINTVTVVNNNGAFSQCRLDMDKIYKGQPEKIAERLRFAETDFTSLAKTYGCWAKKIIRPEEFGAAMNEALSCGKPAVIEVMTNWEIEVPDAL